MGSGTTVCVDECEAISPIADFIATSADDSLPRASGIFPLKERGEIKQPTK
jgi:hypothetical protein